MTAQRLSRRELLRHGVAGLALLPATGCGCLWPRPIQSSVIDAHAHIFNATDLPARRFLRIVLAEDHPPQGVETLLTLDDTDLVDALIDLFLFVVAGRTPDAKAELAVLSGTAMDNAQAADFLAAHAETIRRTTQFLQQTRPTPGSMMQPGMEKLRAAILRAAGRQTEAEFSAPDAPATEQDAEAAYFSVYDIGVYLRWFTLFTMYRHVLADRLAADHRRQGYEPLLLAPALVDYSTWLGQEVESPLADQIRVMGMIARRREGPPVHGYVAFDPMREVFARRGLLPANETSPLALVRSALTDHGFLGVKLYPPMGFKPASNAAGQTYPAEIIEKLGGRVSDDLNAALTDLYTLCIELDAPILAHAAESNGAGPGYAGRADPYHWLVVLRDHPRLRLCLAHFGRFSYRSAGAPASANFPEASWEWQLGAFLKSAPGAPVFVDLSYYSEVLIDSKAERARYAEYLRRYANDFDPDLRHMVFGTDWVMMGRERNYPQYVERLERFLREDCGFGAAAIQRTFVGNAARFLGLQDGAGPRQRLLAFYRRHGIPDDRLPVFQPTWPEPAII